MANAIVDRNKRTVDRTIKPKADPRNRPRSVIVWLALAMSMLLLLIMLELAMWMHGVSRAKMWSRRVAGGTAIFVCILLLIVLWNDKVKTRRWLEENIFVDEAKRQSYKCIRPQGPPGQFVVFPVRVLRRGVPTRFIDITEDALLVELNTNYGAHVDSEKALRSALEATLLPKIAGIDIIIFQGKDAGPTSLAAGVALRNAYGASDPLLATKVAAAILDPSREISSLSPASSFPNSPFNR